MRMGQLQLQSNLKDPVQHCFALLSMFDLYASGILRYVQPTTRNHSVDGFVASSVIRGLHHSLTPPVQQP